MKRERGKKNGKGGDRNERENLEGVRKKMKGQKKEIVPLSITA